MEEKSIVDTDGIYWETRYMIEDGCRFYRIFAKRNNLWYTWIVGEMSQKQAALWNFSVKIEKNGMSLETRGKVSPIDLTVDKILNHGCYLSMTTATMKRLMEKKSDDDSGSISGSIKCYLCLEYTLNKA